MYCIQSSDFVSEMSSINFNANFSDSVYIILSSSGCLLSLHTTKWPHGYDDFGPLIWQDDLDISGHRISSSKTLTIHTLSFIQYVYFQYCSLYLFSAWERGRRRKKSNTRKRHLRNAGRNWGKCSKQNGNSTRYHGILYTFIKKVSSI